MKNNRIAAIILFLFSISFYYFSLSIKYLPSIIFPRMILLLLAFLSILLFLSVGRVTVKKKSDESDYFQNIDYKKLIITVISTIIYIALIDIVGFYTITFIYLVWMIYFFGFRKKGLFIIVPLLALGLILVIFKLWLKIPTPIGIFM